jgi:hypothetical protein
MIYKPSATGYKFHIARDVDSGFVRTIVGPFGSGKSVTCVMDLLMISATQEPDANNVRRTKHAIIRNTYRELLDTTMATFFTWIPKESGVYSALNMTFMLDQVLPDGTQMQAEFLFRALDKPDDIKKLLSLDLTTAWINEVREIAKTVFDAVQGRVGRYPPMVLGVKPTFFGVIADTNAPDIDHWYYKLFEENIPKNHQIFHQPSGISKEAENINNLPRNYYHNMSHGKTKIWIDVYVHGKYGFIADGRPLWPEYKDDTHYNPIPHTPDTHLPLFIGIDFGLTPAAVFGQLASSGQMVIFDELCTWDMGAVSFAKLLKQKLNTTYRGHTNIQVYGDPAGIQRSQSDETTPFQMLSHQGIDAYPTYTNDVEIRREVVADYMQRLDFAGAPAFTIRPGAPTVRKACGGGYKYKRLQVTGEDRYHDVPDKNKYSHAGDALQYLFLGAVGDDRVVGGFDRNPIDYSNYNKQII